MRWRRDLSGASRRGSTCGAVMVTHVVTFRYWRGPRFEQVPAPLKVAFVGTLDECLELRAECERDFVGGGLEVRRCDREVSWYWLHGFEKAKKPRGLSFGSMMRKLEDELGL